VLDDTAIAAVGATLSRIESAITDKQPATAVKLLAGISSDAKIDPRVTDRVKAATDKLQEYGSSQLAQADTLIGDKKYQEASAKLQELDQAFAGLPTADQAKQRLVALQAPDIKAILDAQQKAKDSADELAKAKRLLSINENAAYTMLSNIVKSYPDTPAGAEATQIVAAHEGEAKAEKLIEKGENYESMLKLSVARTAYQEVLDKYPNTKAAAKAKKKLDDLQGQ
jgi:TolA-binding protein